MRALCVHPPRSSDPPEVTISNRTLSEPNRPKFDLLVPPGLSIPSGQSLHFESLSHSSRWQSRGEMEMRDGKEGGRGEHVSIQGSL